MRIADSFDRPQSPLSTPSSFYNPQSEIRNLLRLLYR
jgi:hypothetical protein